jgi:hypothetical protein
MLHRHCGALVPRSSKAGSIQKLGRSAALIAWMPIVRVGNLVKDRRPPKAAALRAALDKIANANRNAVQAIKAAFSAH